MGKAARMKLFLLIAVTQLLVGCHRNGGYNREAALADAYLQQLQAQHPGMTDACVQKIRSGEIGLTGWIDNPDCFEMLPDQRWSGRWDTGWEWTIFCPDSAKNCGAANGGTWMTGGKGVHLPRDFAWGVYHVEFIGRRTKVPGYFGHLDQYAHMMVVDRFISIQKIPGQKYIVPFPK